VQAPDGGEAYTRAGDLRVDSLGLLTTGRGQPVLGNGGPIALPPFETLEIGSDGTISIRPLGQDAAVARGGRPHPAGGSAESDLRGVAKTGCSARLRRR
jgi:flagellar basal-body rod protein FlgF